MKADRPTQEPPAAEHGAVGAALDLTRHPVDVADQPMPVAKVVAYIVRDGLLAVFTHADDQDPVVESGLQVPAGTRHHGESAADAALREAFEETGLTGLKVVRELGQATYDMRPYSSAVHERTFVQLSVEHDVPKTWRHVERDSGTGPPRPFDFRWLPIVQAHVLAAGQGALLARIEL